MQRLVQQKASIAAMLNDSTVTPSRKAVALEILQQEWKTMSDLVQVLEPLQMVTTILCADHEITALSVIPVIFSLCQKFLLPGVDDPDVIKQFKDHVST